MEAGVSNASNDRDGSRKGGREPRRRESGPRGSGQASSGQPSGGGFMDFFQMFGAAQEPEVQESASSASLLQTLLGGKDDAQQNSNGSALLNLLLKSAK